MEDLVSLFVILMAVAIAVMVAISLIALAGTVAAICVFGAATHGFFVTPGARDPASRRRGRAAGPGRARLPLVLPRPGLARSAAPRPRPRGSARARRRRGSRRSSRSRATTGTSSCFASSCSSTATSAWPSARCSARWSASSRRCSSRCSRPARGRSARRCAGSSGCAASAAARTSTAPSATTASRCPSTSARRATPSTGSSRRARSACCAIAARARRACPRVQWLGRERLTSQCPAHGHPLGEGVGIVRTFHVPVAGGPSTGKSTFLAAAMLGLEEAAAAGTLSTAVQSSSRDGYDRLLDGFRRGVLPTKTVDLQAPALVAEVRGRDKSALLYAYDVAGEAYGDEQELRRDPGYGLAEGVVAARRPVRAGARAQRARRRARGGEPELRPSSEAAAARARAARRRARREGHRHEQACPPRSASRRSTGSGSATRSTPRPAPTRTPACARGSAPRAPATCCAPREDTFKEIRCFSTSALGRTPGYRHRGLRAARHARPAALAAGDRGRAAGRGRAPRRRPRRTGCRPPSRSTSRRGARCSRGAINAVTPWPLVANFALGVPRVRGARAGERTGAAGPGLARRHPGRGGRRPRWRRGSVAATASHRPSSPAPPSPPPPPPPPPSAGGSKNTAAGAAPSLPAPLARRLRRRVRADEQPLSRGEPGLDEQRRRREPYLNVVELGPSKFGRASRTCTSSSTPAIATRPVSATRSAATSRATRA